MALVTVTTSFACFPLSAHLPALTISGFLRNGNLLFRPPFDSRGGQASGLWIASELRSVFSISLFRCFADEAPGTSLRPVARTCTNTSPMNRGQSERKQPSCPTSRLSPQHAGHRTHRIVPPVICSRLSRPRLAPKWNAFAPACTYHLICPACCVRPAGIDKRLTVILSCG
jgi:hypothetical protein